MAVVEMKRLSAFVLREDVPRLLRRLMRLHCVDVESVPIGEDCGLHRTSHHDELVELEKKAVQADEAISYLHRKSHEKTPLFRLREENDFERYEAENKAENGARTVWLAGRLASAESELSKHKLKLLDERESYLPFAESSLSPDFAGSRASLLYYCKLPTSVPFSALKASFDELLCTLLTFKEDASDGYAALICHRSEEDAVQRIFAANGITRLSFSARQSFLQALLPDTLRTLLKDVGLSEKFENIFAERAASYGEDSFACRITLLEELIVACDELQNELGELASRVSRQVAEAEAYSDHLGTVINLTEAEEACASSAYTACLCAWVPVSRKEKVEAALERFDCAYEFSDPTAEDDVPVLLNNPKITSPFEMVMGIYSLPAYGTFDPTCIMGLFYLLIFGAMLADVGYGLVLFLGCHIAIKCIPLSKGLLDYCRLFRLCGIACMICGFLFGGYFGDLPTALFGDAVPDIIKNGLILNPLDYDHNGPIKFLVISIGLGVAHLFTGMGIQYYILCREGKGLDAFLDIGSWYIFFAGLGTFVLTMVVSGLPAFVTVIGIAVLAVGALLIFIGSARHEKNPIMFVLKGLLGFYDIINYASDMLSYSRILALGLATSVIAQVINMLTGMASNFILVLVVLILMPALHLFNLALNLLGTFIHTSRLQFIEFFGRFFTDGGRAFSPLSEAEKHTVRKQDDE